jgi:protein-S-isoprenylcysteine O-methyltransferase Ste14
MDEMVYKVLFVVYAVLLALVRLPQHLRYSKREGGTPAKVTRSEYWTFPLAFIGMLIIPLAHIFTPWLEGFRMGLPDPVRLLGPVVATMGLFFLLWVHWTLGHHWSPISEITHEHKLVVEGPYKYIRHPMYTAFYMLIIGASLNLSNWAVTIACLASWHIFCKVRIDAEEAMMKKEFGREYQEYIEMTGSLLPRLRKP